MDIARLVSGKLELELAPVAIDHLVSHAVESVRPSAADANVEIVENISPAAAATIIHADESRLSQAITNLLTNSIKFSPQNSKVTVAADRTESNLTIAVIDQGVGIKPEFLPDVFERFRQDESTGARSKGLGLGLAIVRNLVELHGGSVKAESEGENKGSTFTITLPVNATAENDLAFDDLPDSV